jgi:hypothetical protein
MIHGLPDMRFDDLLHPRSSYFDLAARPLAEPFVQQV